MIIADTIDSERYAKISGEPSELLVELQNVSERIFKSLIKKYGQRCAEELMKTCFENVMDVDITDTKKFKLFR